MVFGPSPSFYELLGCSLGSPSLHTARLRDHSPSSHFLVSSICLNCFPLPDKLRSVGMETICGKFSQNKAPLDLGVQGLADTGAYFGRTFKVRRPGTTASCRLPVAGCRKTLRSWANTWPVCETAVNGNLLGRAWLCWAHGPLTRPGTLNGLYLVAPSTPILVVHKSKSISRCRK